MPPQVAAEEKSNRVSGGGFSSLDPATRTLLRVFALGAALIGVLTGYLINREYHSELSHWEVRLSGVADDRAAAVSDWLDERRADAEVLSNLPTVVGLLRQRVPGQAVERSPLQTREYLTSLMERFRRVYGYAGLYLVDSEGRVVARSIDDPRGEAAVSEIARAVAQQQAFRIDLLGDSPDDSRLSFSMPVLGTVEPGRSSEIEVPVIGVVSLHILLRVGLFPLLNVETSPTRTGETLLARREGQEAVFMSPLRHPRPEWGTLRLPLATERLAARQALEVGESSGEFIDYRGVRVLAATRRIPQTGWGLVRKIDREEALTDFRQTALVDVAVAAFFIVLLGTGLRSYRRGQLTRSLQARLEQQRALLRLKGYAQEIVNSIPAGLLVLSSDLRVLSANVTFYKLFQLAPEEVVGRRLEEVIQAERPPYRSPSAFEGEAPPQSVLIDVVVADRDAKHPVRLMLKPLEHETEEGRLLLFIEDQTASERLRATAEASERRLRDLVQSLDVIVWEANAETLQFTFASQRAEAILGYPVEQWLSESNFWENHIDPADREAAVGACREAAAQGRDSELEYRMIAADGRVVWLRDLVRVVTDAEGRPRQLRGVMVDITERKRAEEERARLGLAVEQAAESILITDLEGTILYVNPAFEQTSGYSRAEVIGKNPRILKSGRHDREFYRSLWARLTSGEVWTGYFVNKRKDGSLFEAEAVISPVRDAAGRVVNYVAVERDVTRERQLEEQVRQSQRVEAVGRLAGGIAHDFNNLLTVISGYSQLAMDRTSPGDPVAGYIAEVRRAADRAASLTRQLLAFSRRQVLAPQVLDLNAVVQNMEKMLRRLISEDIELVTLTDPNLGWVKADPGQLEQVILNLVINARDAMPQGGKLTIETANAELDASYGMGHFPVTPGPYVMLAVNDTGIGMDAETRAHIFEPFFTTKKVGKGTGLGLAMVYGIVKQSGGYIWLYSEPGQGTTFQMYLPRVWETAGAVQTAPAAETRTDGTETVLMVEDEEGVRSLVRGVLRARGYTVLEARDGVEALAVCEKWDKPVDLLLTDVVMPQMGGAELAGRLTDRFPRIKVLYMSGHTEEGIVQRGVLEPGSAYLQKPFTPEVLARKLREVLDAK